MRWKQWVPSFHRWLVEAITTYQFHKSSDIAWKVQRLQNIHVKKQTVNEALFRHWGLSARKEVSEQHWCEVISPKHLLVQVWPGKILGRKELPSVVLGTEQLHQFPFRGEAQCGTCHQTALGKSLCWLHLSEFNSSLWSSTAARRGWESSWKSHCRAETCWDIEASGTNKLPPRASIWLHSFGWHSKAKSWAASRFSRVHVKGISPCIIFCVICFPLYLVQ